MERNVDTRVINRYLESCHSPPDNKVLKVAQLAIYGHGSFHKVNSSLRF